MKFLKKNILLILGLSIVLTMFFLAVFAPLIAPYDPNMIDPIASLEGPSVEHLFGTDELGRDLFSRMLYGARISLFVGFIAVSISSFIGIIIGLASGYFGGLVDEALMRFVDIMLCFPSFFLILAVITFLEPNVFTIMTVIGFTSWMGIARLVRAETLSMKQREFISASKLAGASSLRILVFHILPNVLAPALVSMTLGIAGAILVESSLSFLGIGVQPPEASWGNILQEGKSVLEIAPWISLYPGLAIVITVLGYNLLGEALRDWLDPRMNKQ